MEGGPTSRGTSPLGALFGTAPPPSSSQNHSPAGSYTADLPPDAFLSVGNDPGYDSFSDSESVAESLSNAASRLVVRPLPPSQIAIFTFRSFEMATSRLSDPLRSSSTRSPQSRVLSHWMNHMRMLLSMHCILGLRSRLATAVTPEVRASATIGHAHILKYGLLAIQGHHPYHLML